MVEQGALQKQLKSGGKALTDALNQTQHRRNVMDAFEESLKEYRSAPTESWSKQFLKAAGPNIDSASSLTASSLGFFKKCGNRVCDWKRSFQTQHR